MFFEEHDSFIATPTRAGIPTYVVALEFQADSTLECSKPELVEISCNTIKWRTETKILAHVIVGLDWKKRKTLQKYHQIVNL